jgi:hypothetical protein
MHAGDPALGYGRAFNEWLSHHADDPSHGGDQPLDPLRAAHKYCVF